MQKLLDGVRQFQSSVFGTKRDLFTKLGTGQSPETLFVTCSDSRIDPNLITQTEPGELFVVRNAGNMVPSYGIGGGGEAASIEFAVAALGVRRIIVCGHSHCGAMKGLLDLPSLEGVPAVAAWLKNAESTRRVMVENYKELTGAALVSACVQENVLAQIENIKTHPAVASRLASNQITLHAWVYKIESGEVFSYDPAAGQFKLISDASGKLESTPLNRQTSVSI